MRLNNNMGEVKITSKKRPDTADVGLQINFKNKFILCDPSSRLTFYFLGVIIGIVSFVTFLCYTIYFQNLLYTTSSDIDSVGETGILLFRQFDRDGDGYLSIEEFEPFIHLVGSVKTEVKYDETIQEGDEVFTLETHFQPLNLESMSKSDDYMFTDNVDSMLGLKSWRQADSSWKNFGVSQFRTFLPNNAIDEMSHNPYPLIELYDLKGTTLSSNRYYPMPLTGDNEILIHRLLALFHPRPFIHPRFGPQGSFAIVRASNENFLDIVYRIHAEFQLNEPPMSPFWFTPAQFTGHIIIDRSASHLVEMNLFVPSDKRLNVDMEWINGPRGSDNMEVDIGYMPQMELKSTRSSKYMYESDGNITNQYIQKEDTSNSHNIKWDDEISLAEALRLLEIKMYPFKQVEYMNFSEVWSAAEREQKPVHSILLWGALDDQSC